MEIERKFLVNVEKLPTERLFSARIVQGYLSLNPLVRVRLSSSVVVGNELTIKGKGLISREEWSFPLSREIAQKMLAMCPLRLEKTRHRLLNSPWEVDEFHGHLQGFWLAEIELDSEDQEYGKPEWVGEEVSLDPRFQNVNLARSREIPKFPCRCGGKGMIFIEGDDDDGPESIPDQIVACPDCGHLR